MRFSTTTIIAFIGMGNALPAPSYGTDSYSSAAFKYPKNPEYRTSAIPSSLPACLSCGKNSAHDPYIAHFTLTVTGTGSLDVGEGSYPTGSAYVPVDAETRTSAAATLVATSDYLSLYGSEMRTAVGTVSVPTPTGGYSWLHGGEIQVPGPLIPTVSNNPRPSGGSNVSAGGGATFEDFSEGGLEYGGGFDLGGLIGGLLSGGKQPGLKVGAGGGLSLQGVVSSLTSILEASSYLDGSGHLNIGALLDGLKDNLVELPGGAELAEFCNQLKSALGGGSRVSLSVLVPGIEALLSGSGKFDLGGALGINVGSLISGLKLLLEASINGSGGLNIGGLLDSLEAFLAESGHLDLGAGPGLELNAIITQFRTFLSTSTSVSLDIRGILHAFGGFLSGSVNFGSFIAASGKLPDGQHLISLCGQLMTISTGLGIDLNVIAKQIVLVLGVILKGTALQGQSVLAGTVVDLNAILGLTANIENN